MHGQGERNPEQFLDELSNGPEIQMQADHSLGPVISTRGKQAGSEAGCLQTAGRIARAPNREAVPRAGRVELAIEANVVTEVAQCLGERSTLCTYTSLEHAESGCPHVELHMLLPFSSALRKWNAVAAQCAGGPRSNPPALVAGRVPQR